MALPLTHDELGRLLELVKQINEAAKRYVAHARAAPSIEQQNAAAWMYWHAVRSREPNDSLVAEAHRVMLKVFDCVDRVPELPGARADEALEMVRVFVALNIGGEDADSERKAVRLARAASAIEAGLKAANTSTSAQKTVAILKSESDAKAILQEPLDATDGGMRDRVQKVGVMDRYLQALDHRHRVAERLLESGGWPIEEQATAREQLVGERVIKRRIEKRIRRLPLG